MSRILTVASGKGGVGKTNLSANLALGLADQGHRVCLFDADLGLANINILFGLYPDRELKDVILDGCSVKDILIKDFNGIDIIPGSSANGELSDLDSGQIERLVKSFSELNNEYDFFLFDTSAGISKSVISFCLYSNEVILVITPEPTSLTDGYALLKVLSKNGFTGSAMIVVNQSKDVQNAKAVYIKFKQVVQKYLPTVNIVPLGAVLHDKNVIRAVKAQEPFLHLYPNSTASNCVKRIARELADRNSSDIEIFSLDDFWERCLSVLNRPLRAKTRTEGFKEEGQNAAPQTASEAQKRVCDDNSTREGSQAQCAAENYPKYQQSVQDFLPILDSLNRNIASIAEDIAGIRKSMESQKDAKLVNERPAENAKKREATIIPLDFDAFVRQRKE